ncbi:MAG: translation initiation factor IF-2 [Candidatus Woesearchaeota archaeon]
MATRSPIVSILGHVDHGKSSVLDSIRGSNILATEAGAITQAIGASIVPIEAITKRVGDMLKTIGTLTIPGLLFIDTPGHAAFTTLRKRGGTLADLAVLVVDINEGFKPQTLEAINILREKKTPFIVAANKIDLIPGYRIQKKRVLEDIEAQPEKIRNLVDTKLYQLVGAFYEQFSMQADRFDRVDFTKQLAIVPCSAKNGLGIPELLMLLAGLAQKFMGNKLTVDTAGSAKGTILEVKEDKGLGTTIDVILYDGMLSVNDTIIIPTSKGPIATKVRALLEPAALQEMRDKKSTFKHVQCVKAATGVKISAPGLTDVIAGMPLISCIHSDAEQAVETLRHSMENIRLETESSGIIIKADTMGSLEALMHMLKEAEIPVGKAGIGPITKKDYADAEANGMQEATYGVILGFNIPLAESSTVVKVFVNDIIYRIIEDYEEWAEAKRRTDDEGTLSGMTKPCKIEVLKNCIFRQSNPCIVGVEVVGGTATVGTPLMKKGKLLGIIKSMQEDKDSVQEAKKGTQLAMSIPGVAAGRQINEGDVLYTHYGEQEFRKMKDYRALLRADELEVLKEIALVMREETPLWGV